MKYYTTQLLIVTLIILLSSESIFSQTDLGRQREIGLSFGTSTINLFESRFSANTKKFRAPTFGFFSRSQSSTYKHEFVFNYTLRGKYDKTQLLDYRLHRPDFYFSLQRKASFGWIGGNINLSTLLTFPSNVTGHYSNAPISYTMAASIGPSVSIDRSIGSDSPWLVEADLHTSLLAYVIRPSYGHPYPDQFLEPETFTPTREGMAPKLLTSGKIRAMDKYQSIKLRIGIYYLIDSKVKMGLVASMDYVNYNEVKSTTYNNQNIAVTASYIY